MAQQRSNRGFASMDPEAQRAIARKGGRAAHESGHAHEWTPEEAAKAGHRGGLAAHHRGRGAAHRDTAARRHPGTSTGQTAPEHSDMKSEQLEQGQRSAAEEQPPESEREHSSQAEQELEEEQQTSRPSRGRAARREGEADNG